MSMDYNEWAIHLPVPLVVLDENMDVVDASRAAFSLFRIRFRPSRQAESLKELSDFLMEKQSFISLVGEASLKLSGLGSRDHLIWTLDERSFEIEISSMPPEESMHYGLYFKDVTQVLEFEKSRELTRNYLKQIIDSLPAGIVVIDRDLVITALNRSMHKLVAGRNSITPGINMLGLKISDILPACAGESWNEVAERVFVQQESLSECRYDCVINGEKCVFEVELLPLRNSDGELIGAVYITQDLTDVLSLQEEARHNETIAAKTETLHQTVTAINNVVHTKMMTILCNLKAVLAEEDALSNQAAPILADVLDEAEQIEQFIRDLSNKSELKVSGLPNRGESVLDIAHLDSHD